MRIGYFDCFSGASGDMILGAMLDAGLPLDELCGHLEKLPVSGFTLRAEKLTKQGFAATRCHVDLDPQQSQPHRHLSHIRELIEASDLPASVQARAVGIFVRLAEAEAAVHGSTPERVHFHEVGAVDAVVDVVGASLGIELLGIDRVVCSPIPTGSGTVKCDHGIMPVPAPATAQLLRGVPLAAADEPAELTTPTGAAILTTLSESFGPLPQMTLDRIGVGAGARDGVTRPNVMRLLIGQQADRPDQDQVVVLEANLDDQDPRQIAYAFDQLLEAGALDVYAAPIVMKKNRPATKLSVIAPVDRVDPVERVLFAETTTFGVRRWTCDRTKLQRSHRQVQTPYGAIRVKLGYSGEQLTTATAEHEDCRAAARQHGVALRVVVAAAMQAWQQIVDSE